MLTFNNTLLNCNYIDIIYTLERLLIIFLVFLAYILIHYLYEYMDIFIEYVYERVEFFLHHQKYLEHSNDDFIYNQYETINIKSSIFHKLDVIKEE